MEISPSYIYIIHKSTYELVFSFASNFKLITRGIELLIQGRTTTRLDELQHSGNQLLNPNTDGSRIHNNPRHLTDIVIRTPTVPLQQPLNIPPRGRLVPSTAIYGGFSSLGGGGGAELEPTAPLGLVGGLALDDEEAGGVGGSEVEEAVEVGPAGEGRVDDEAVTEAELGGGEAPDDGVGEVVEEGEGVGGGG